MTHMGLSHAAKTPNMPSPQGKMSHDKMLDFVNKVAKTGLQHLADGGTTAGGISGGISGALGLQNTFQAGSANILGGTNATQLNDLANNAAGALNQQQNITNPLTNNLTQGSAGELGLGQQLYNQAQGKGPNPAQAELNQSTGQNIAQQAALAAGQRGAGANAGLIAAQNAQQGAATQQQAVGQGATLAAQEQIAAQNSLQNLSANEVAQGQGAVQGLNNATQNEQNILQGANTAFNNAQVGMQSNINNVNAGISQGNQTSAGNVLGSVASGLSSAAGYVGALFAKGGKVKPQWVTAHQMMAEGGVLGSSVNAPQSFVGNWLNSASNTGAPLSVPQVQLDTKGVDPFANVKAPTIGGDDDEDPAQSSLTESDVNNTGGLANSGALSTGASDLSGLGMSMAAYGGLMKQGGKVGGKAKVGHDSYSNDTVPAMLSPGEVVIDLNTLKDPGPLGKKARFVAASIERNKAKRGAK